MPSGREKDNKFNQLIRERIREARTERAMSQEDLARQLYKGRVAISDLERGRVQVSASDLILIADALEKPISYFFPANMDGPAESELTPREKELVTLFRQIEGNEHLEQYIIDIVRKWAETLSDLMRREHVLIALGKIPEPKDPQTQE